jgi:hypothetical protein
LIAGFTDAGDTTLVLNIGDPGDPQNNSHNNSPEITLSEGSYSSGAYSNVASKRVSLRADSTARISITKLVNNNTSNISMTSDSIFIEANNGSKTVVNIRGNLKVEDTTNLQNLRVGNYNFPDSGPNNPIGSVQGFQLRANNIGDLEWYNPNGASIGPANPIDIDSLSDAYYDNNNNLYLGSVPGSLILSGNTNANANVAVGKNALLSNEDGEGNVAVGQEALYLNESGMGNSALGRFALRSNISGYGNVAAGPEALSSNTTGNTNIGLGRMALRDNKTGMGNVAFGANAGNSWTSTPNENSSESIFIGQDAKTDSINSNNQIVIGAYAHGNGSNSVTLGSDYINKTILKGNIGIGTNTPNEKLHVFSQSGDAIVRVEGSSNSSEARTEFWKWSGQYGSSVGFWPGNSNLRLRTMSNNGTNAGGIAFETESTEKMFLNQDGNLGIGTSNPNEALEINRDIGNSVIKLNSVNAYSNLDFYDNSNFSWGIGKNQNDQFYITETTPATGNGPQGGRRLVIENGSADITLNGNISIGNYNSSGAILDAGKLKMRTGANNGYIPVSDPDGNMTWTDPDSINTGIASSSWFEANTSSLPDDINDDVYTNGKVGINTNNPQYDLEINGNIGFKSWNNTADSAGIYFQSNSDNAQIRYVSRDDDPGNTFLEISTGDNGDEPIIFSQGASHLGNNGNVVNNPNQERMRIHENGYVGIWTNSPTEKLDVDGKIRMRDGANNGYIAVSEPDGTMTWTDPTTINALTGATGVQGVTGADGADGSNGQDGADGVDGTNGQDGADGARGATGVQGVTGADGADGSNGQDGADGIDGSNGQDGADGVDGTNGQDGADGARGATGVQGVTGADGADGSNGQDGADGARGATGVQGVTGADGADGSNGQDGADGARGATGVQGVTGADGADGSNGQDGADGARGATGVQGVTGADGADGSNGQDGADGVDGTNGQDGADGAARGATGVQGVTGADGADGSNGQDGADGTRGATGFQGATGADGADGSNGQGARCKRRYRSSRSNWCRRS